MTDLRTLRLLATIAGRNVVRGWRHSLAAILTMAIGFLALATFQGYLEELLDNQVASNLARNMMGELLIRKPGVAGQDGKVNPRKYWMSEKEQDFIENWLAHHQAEVKVRVRQLLVHGMATAGGSNAAFMAIGHDVAEGEKARQQWGWNAWAGHPLRADQPTGVVLGLGLGRLLGCQPTGTEAVFDPHTAALRPIERSFQCKNSVIQLTAGSTGGRVNAVDAEVVGLTSGQVREFDLRMIYLSLPLLQQLAETQSVGLYSLLLRDPSQAEQLRAELSAEISHAGLDLEATEWRDTEMAELFRRGKALVGAYRNLVVLVLLLIAGTAVLTTMAKTVRERSREIGTLRSLGFGQGQMQALFAIEAALLAVVASAVGGSLALGLRALINGAAITYRAGLLAEDVLLEIGLSPITYAAGFGFLLVVAVLASWLAARRLVRLRVAEIFAEG
jgi:putative ABC transport system permease protein